MYKTVEKNELHLQLTELEDLFDARVKEPGATGEELTALAREHTRLLERFNSLK
jgi:hypothetical protein